MCLWVFERAAVSITSCKKLTKNTFSCPFNKQGIILSGSVALGCLLIETLIPGT